ncbi:MAG TPA: hypothetical protein VM165_17460, partial [Planctomycetaceae bacterium]|nr:hypothetical protein [Planctomycetaceae bacterium]
MTMRPPHRVRSIRFVASASIVLICCGCPSKPPAPPAPPPTPKTASGTSAVDCAPLLSQKNVAVGQLENDKFVDAMPAFAELATALPNDPLGPRNLVV